MKFYNLITTLLFLLTCVYAHAQSLGKHDPKINWEFIETENVKVIFPQNSKDQAERIADVIDYIRNNKTISVGSKSKKIDLVLQNQQTISNGFVTLSPYRSEFFAISPQDQSSLGTTNWLDLLSIHEYRHALQYANANRGVTKFFHIIAGQNGWAASQGLSIPSWYLEGDAVLIETLLSENGRGRNPYFFKEQRSLLLEDNIYSYHKAQNGSFKDIVPSIYPLGFAINNYLRNNYSIETGSKILADAGRYKYWFYPFSSAMKKHTGFTTTQMYKRSIRALQKKWQQEANALSLSKSNTISKENTKTVTNYTFPQYLNESTIIAIKKTYKETPSIVKIQNGNEKKLTSIGIASEEYLSSTNNKLTWTEHKKDLRHENKNYSNIVTYDITSKTKKTITNKKRYFSPTISNSETKIAAIQYDEKISYSIDILDFNTGALLSQIPTDNNDFVGIPKWTKNDSSIIYLVKRNSKLAFFKYTFNSDKTTQISDWTTNTIGQYSIGNNEIFFTSSFSGIDNIYSIDLNGNRNIKQISSVKVGAYFPSISKNQTKLVYSEFTTSGYKIHELDVDKIEEIPYSIPNLKNENFYQLKTTSIEHSILDSVPENTYEAKKYKGFFKGTKLHSWGLTTSTTTTNTFGAGVQFQNILNDFSGNVALLHNLNEGTNSLRANIGYGKGLLNWNIKTATQNRSAYATINKFPVVSDFTELYYGGGFSIPISQYSGNYVRSFNFETNYIQHITSNYKISDIDYPNNLNFGAIESSLTISNIRRRAYQNLGPKFGQYIKLNYSKSIDATTADKIVINSIFYFPGILKNHSLTLVANWQKELLSNSYQYSDTFRYARGYSTYLNDEVGKLSFNYALPLIYPDFGIWGLTYFKRIRLNIFYDTSVLDTNTYTNTGSEENPILEITPINMNQNSVGGELIFDNTFFNIAPISIGLRQSLLLNTDINNQNKTYAFDMFLQIGF